MLFRKQKQQLTRRPSTQQKSKQCPFIIQYRTLIAPVDFTLKEIQTYGSILPIQTQNIQSSSIDENVLREIIVDTLKLTFIYEPLLETLKKQFGLQYIHFPFKAILRILFRGQFYKYIQNNENQLKILINNRTTESNVKIIISSLYVYVLKKISIEELNLILLFFSLQSALYNTDQLYLPMDTQKIMKVLRKLERIIKPIEYKIWIEGVKNSKEFLGSVQAHHFIYLCSLTEKKSNNGLGVMMFKPKLQFMFKNMNNQAKPSDEIKEEQKQMQEERRIIRGLSFCEIRPKKYSISKQILREIRLRNPSKNKRPNTAQFRRQLSTFLPPQKMISPKMDIGKSKVFTAHPLNEGQFSNKEKRRQRKVQKKNFISSAKSMLRLKLNENRKP